MKSIAWTPTISAIIPTYNSAKTLDRCLKTLRQQDYPQSKIEIILADGGSTDQTVEIANKYQAKVVKVPKDKQNAEYNRGVAYNQAKGELVLVVDHDNFLPSTNWLQQMIKPLAENHQMVATTTCYYHYDRSYGLMDRYFALLGAGEPLPYYLGKADRMPQYQKQWSLSGQAEDCGDYFRVTFTKNPRQFPSIGTNGCLMRRQLVSKHAKVQPENHYPIDVMFDLVQAGHPQFGFVKNSIIHLTHARGLWAFLGRRRKFAEDYHFNDQNFKSNLFSLTAGKRRWSVFMKGDEMALLKFVIYSLTVVKPLLDAVYGFIRIPDLAWFVHPLMCLATTMLYGYAIVKNKLR